ncbi:hypothetical protein JCM1841_003682 [Sporobolomyces salmonicolor]
MEDFSRSDQIRALLSPLCCCLAPARLALSPSSDSLAAPAESDSAVTATHRSWYDQSRLPHAFLPGSWNDQGRRTQDDLLSLHEGVGGTARRRFRTRGGDITGGGANEGSGLTRWMLFKSWWRGGGAIRLPDDDEAEVGSLRGTDEDGDDPRSFTVDGADDSEADAVPLDVDSIAIPPAPAPLPSTASPHSPVPSESPTLVDSSAGREARRAHRRARRRARELGITVEEFEQGVAVEPNELLHAPFLDVETSASPASRTRSNKSSKASSRTSSTDSRSRAGERGFTVDDAAASSRDNAYPSSLPVLAEDENLDSGADELLGPARKPRRHHHGEGRGSSRGSRHSASSEGEPRTHGASSVGSSRSGRSRQGDLVPLPLSTGPGAFESTPPDAPKRPRHRSRPSTSTVSTTSSSRRPKKQPHLSPLHDDGIDGAALYYQDERGQLQPYPHAQGPYYDYSPPALQSPAAAAPQAGAYDHIGVLPAPLSAESGPPSPPSDPEQQRTPVPAAAAVGAAPVPPAAEENRTAFLARLRNRPAAAPSASLPAPTAADASPSPEGEDGDGLLKQVEGLLLRESGSFGSGLGGDAENGWWRTREREGEEQEETDEA